MSFFNKTSEEIESEKKIKAIMKRKGIAVVHYILINDKQTVDESPERREKLAKQFDEECYYEPMGMHSWSGRKLEWVQFQIDQEKQSAKCEFKFNASYFSGKDNKNKLLEIEALPNFRAWCESDAFDLAGVTPNKEVIKIKKL